MISGVFAQCAGGAHYKPSRAGWATSLEGELPDPYYLTESAPPWKLSVAAHLQLLPLDLCITGCFVAFSDLKGCVVLRCRPFT